MGPLHPAQARASTAARPRSWSRRSWTTSTSCSGSGSTAAGSRPSSCASSPACPPEFARDTADITDRQNVQLHWIRIEDVPEIWRRLEAVGLSTTEACGDTPRVILGSPVAGIAADEIIDGSPAIDAIQDRFIGYPEFSNLPRKFKTAICGSPLQDVAHEINDIAFVGVVHPEHGPGFDVWVGGGLSTNPMLAQRLGAWVPLEEVPDVWAGVVGLFRDYGYRRLRTRARIKFLVADWGVEKFRQVLEEEYLGASSPTARLPPVPYGSRDHVGVHRQQDGRYYVGFAPTVGRVSGTTLAQIADIAEAHGSDRVRTTAAAEADRPRRARGPGRLAGRGRCRRWACAPSRAPSAAARWPAPASSSASWRSSRPRPAGAELIDELERRLPDFDEPLTINVNGCPNSCARIQVADIGLKGQLVLDADGNQVEGFQVHLGGGARPGRRLRPQAARPQGHRRRAARLRRAGGPALPASAGRRAVRAVGRPRRRGGTAMSERVQTPRGAVLLPVLRRRGPAAARDTHGAWDCSSCTRVFTLKLVGLVTSA